jgi:hypothetical protein
MRLGRLIASYACALLLACVAIHWRSSTHPPDVPIFVASKWKDGTRIDRAVASSESEARAKLGDGTVVIERVLGSAPVPSWEPLRALSFAPSIDGVRAEMDGKVAYLTVDDLLAHAAYDRWMRFGEGFSLGLDLELAYALLASDLHAAPSEIKARARIERVRFERTVAGPRADTLADEDVRQSMFAAALYLARGVSGDGRFRYLVDGLGNKDKPGYDWPRHAGTTYFLAQATRLGAGREVAAAARRAADRIRDVALSTCGAHRCVGDDDPVEIGSSALATLAFVEAARAGIDSSYGPLALELADFLRSQQRPDGELMHYCRKDGTPIDQQNLYFSGEAALALARTNELAQRKDDLDAARRAVSYLTGPAWSFVGDRYLFGEEHWTCQAAAELWSRAPDPKALDFCVRWMEYSRALQAREGDAPFDVDGGMWLGPMVAPHLTPIASRAEAGGAILAIARQAGLDRPTIDALEDQLRRSIALLIRHQMTRGVAHITRDPAAVSGGLPASTVDFSLRIDFAQHAGSAMGRWLERPR